MALPPIPPLPDPSDPLFSQLMAIRTSIQALYRDAAITDQTSQMAASAVELHASTLAMQQAAAAATAPATDAEIWLRFMSAQFASDPSGTVRTLQGVGNMAGWASQALAEYRARFPQP